MEKNQDQLFFYTNLMWLALFISTFLSYAREIYSGKFKKHPFETKLQHRVPPIIRSHGINLLKIFYCKKKKVFVGKNIVVKTNIYGKAISVAPFRIKKCFIPSEGCNLHTKRCRIKFSTNWENKFHRQSCRKTCTHKVLH